jgi:hypothetical protein
MWRIPPSGAKTLANILFVSRLCGSSWKGTTPNSPAPVGGLASLSEVVRKLGGFVLQVVPSDSDSTWDPIYITAFIDDVDAP